MCWASRKLYDELAEELVRLKPTRRPPPILHHNNVGGNVASCGFGPDAEFADRATGSIELVIHLKVAKLIGRTIPQTLLARADVIE